MAALDGAQELGDREKKKRGKNEKKGDGNIKKHAPGG